MRLISRYIIRQFCPWLLVNLAAFIGIFIVVDLIENLDKFIDRHLQVVQIIHYYILYIPHIIILMLPVAMLLSALFSIGELSRNNEITAIKASGISLYQVILPLLGFALLVSLFSLVFGETVVPVANRLKENIKEGREKRITRIDRTNVFLQDIHDQIIFVRYYNAKKKSARDVSIQKYSDSSLVRRVDAKRMLWKNGGWELHQGKIREFTGDQLTERTFVSLRAEGLTIVPEDLARRQKRPDEMNYIQLRRYISRARQIGCDTTRWLVDLYMKFSFPFANFVVVLFGASLATRIRRTGKAVGFALSIIICFLYYVVMNSGQALGRNGVLNPVLSAWQGNVLFGALGLTLLLKARK
ncbi:MAG: LPS export ABC transporter permease LptG [Candidatus Latescibacterota bacterium]|nr:MAG: LPS export ABC transporter permease LptG [Candidatus Latescibacterota bacterium]RKY74080.1 MAG: LPS export ABC transporter permease LptG [Candidatus Latescibacterota bacterium]HDN67493.1 LPS export ABC transporter permease LptG [Bacillota bacterium]